MQRGEDYNMDKILYSVSYHTNGSMQLFRSYSQETSIFKLESSILPKEKFKKGNNSNKIDGFITAN